MARSWCVKLPSDLFLGFSAVATPDREGKFGLELVFGGGAVDKLYTLIRSSEDPVASSRLSASFAAGEMDRHRIAAVCAAKRKVS